MRSWMMILTALLCLNVAAQEATTGQATTGQATTDQTLNASESVNEEELVKAAEAIAKTDPSFSTNVNTALPESQIPVFSKGKSIEKAEGNPVWRVIASMVIICLVGGGVIYVAKKRGFKKNPAAQAARIEVLHQHHFGPKKGLALVRVAGEVVLIGITDHAINMIKPVTLIDDEVEGLLGKDFNNFLEDDFTIGSVQSAIRARV